MNKIGHLLFIAVLCFSCTKQIDKKTEVISTASTVDIKKEDLKDLYSEVKSKFEALTPRVIQPAEGYLKYPYLIPAGFYKQMWDWDGFFMGNYLASKGKPEYLKYWAENLILGIDDEGYVSGCATTKGPRPIFGKFAMKPFLSQGIYLASTKLDDFEWIRVNYNKIKSVLSYREKTQQDSITGLFFWDIAMQSGADNNAGMNYFMEDKRSYLAPDASAWQYKEYLAQAAIAKKLGIQDDATHYTDKATKLKEAINTYLWSDKDEIYYTVDRETREFYKRISYSSFVPFAAGLASEENGRKAIERYLIAPEHMKAKYGYRTLSASDPDYNNKNIIVPFSNWQGPVWPIANYIYSIGLKKYNFDLELNWLGKTMGNLLINDINKYDTMHENYHADTGAPLAPSDDHVDENGKIVGFISWNLCVENILNGVVNDDWMLLDIN